ncbi:MAG: response regulator transcription factor [Ferruginibacter sp.]
MHKQIILVDDHVLLRDALATLINSFPEFNVLSVASNGIDVIKAIEEGNIPDIVVLDLNMPKMDGFETAAWLKNNHPDIKVVILTMYDSEIALIRLLQAGVRGFLKKDIHPMELKNALIAVAENGYYYSHQATGKLGTLFKKNNDAGNSIERAFLTDIEIDFIKNACSEMTYKEIALKMSLTPRTIDNYRDSLFDKLNVKSRVGLAIYAVKNGVVTF